MGRVEVTWPTFEILAPRLDDIWYQMLNHVEKQQILL